MRLFAKTPAAVRAARRQAAQYAEQPWFPIGGFSGGRLRALRRELHPEHALAGVALWEIAASEAGDDVMFCDAEGRVYCVHLTYAPPTSPNFPAFCVEASVADAFRTLADEKAYVAAIEADEAAERIVCAACGADWGANEHGPNCPTCGGHALTRPCPHCRGACGGFWRRAVLDSNEMREAIWIGQCGGASSDSA